MPKKITAYEKFEKLYTKNPEIIYYSMSELSNLLKVSNTRSSDIKNQFIR